MWGKFDSHKYLLTHHANSYGSVQPITPILMAVYVFTNTSPQLLWQCTYALFLLIEIYNCALRSHLTSNWIMFETN